jgi:hypothetical protein
LCCDHAQDWAGGVAMKLNFWRFERSKKQISLMLNETHGEADLLDVRALGFDDLKWEAFTGEHFIIHKNQELVIFKDGHIVTTAIRER